MQWEAFLQMLEKQWGLKPSIEALLLLIGLQETGELNKRLSKDQKLRLIDIGMCVLLERTGYMQRSEEKDAWGYPKFRSIKPFPYKDTYQQQQWIQENILRYFQQQD